MAQLSQLLMIPTSIRQALLSDIKQTVVSTIKEETRPQVSCDVTNAKPPLLLREDQDLDFIKHLLTTETPKVDVSFLNLKRVYEKRQTRVHRKSRQKILKGKVEMAVMFDAQVQDITVMVERTAQSRVLCGDNSAQIRLDVKMGRLETGKQYFSVDLDSVYLSNDGQTPVYKLSTVDSYRRNMFHLAVTLEFIDGSRSEVFYSQPFLLRSHRKEPLSICVNQGNTQTLSIVNALIRN